jgi:hypothetical protein
MPAGSGRYPSGQRGQTVNLLAYAFGGSNPPLPTIVAMGLSTARSVGGLSEMGVAPFVAMGLSTARSVGGLFEVRVAPTSPFNRGHVGPRVARAAAGARSTDSTHSAHVAQLAEHALGKGEVSGSIPDMGSRFFSPTKRGAHGR